MSKVSTPSLAPSGSERRPAHAARGCSVCVRPEARAIVEALLAVVGALRTIIDRVRRLSRSVLSLHGRDHLAPDAPVAAARVGWV